jgi:hypothetical protein
MRWFRLGQKTHRIRTESLQSASIGWQTAASINAMTIGSTRGSHPAILALLRIGLGENLGEAQTSLPVSATLYLAVREKRK